MRFIITQKCALNYEIVSMQFKVEFQDKLWYGNEAVKVNIAQKKDPAQEVQRSVIYLFLNRDICLIC